MASPCGVRWDQESTELFTVCLPGCNSLAQRDWRCPSQQWLSVLILSCCRRRAPWTLGRRRPTIRSFTGGRKPSSSALIIRSMISVPAHSSLPLTDKDISSLSACCFFNPHFTLLISSFAALALVCLCSSLEPNNNILKQERLLLTSHFFLSENENDRQRTWLKGEKDREAGRWRQREAV